MLSFEEIIHTVCTLSRSTQERHEMNFSNANTNNEKVKVPYYDTCKLP